MVYACLFNCGWSHLSEQVLKYRVQDRKNLRCKEYLNVFCLFLQTGTIFVTSGPDCSKLTTSLVNVSLKFQTLLKYAITFY